MNLIQINERLKDLPMQVVQQYANGMNPEVPPYLALGELQRREMSQKQMATAQGAMQGAQPSVKEQVEQKAGLMALQQMQQQQMAQQMAQPRGPMPTSENTPQPVDQPEATMMASGGLASVPVQFDFASGGIVAFNGETGSDVKPKYETPYDRRNRENREAAMRAEQERGPRALAVTQNNATALVDAAKNKVAELEADKDALVRRFGAKQYEQALARAQSAVVAASSRGEERVGQQAQLGQERVAAATPAPQPAAQPFGSNFAPVNPADMMGSPAGLKAAAEQKQRQQGPRPTPAAVVPAEPAAPAPAAPAQPDPNSMDAMFRAQLGNAPKERTVAEIQAEQRAIREGAGLTEPAGLAQMDRIRKMQEQYEGSKPSGLDDLIRVFGQAGQYKGLSGLAPAYTANQQQKRAQDLAMAKQINEMMSGVETTQRGEMKDIATGTSTARGTDRAAGVDFTKNLMTALGTARNQDSAAETQRRGQDITAASAKYNADMHYKSAMAQMSNANARQDAQEKRLLLDSFKARIASIDKELGPMLKSPFGPNKDAITTLQAEKAGLTKALDEASGISKITKAPGAASPGGTNTSGWGKAQVVKQ
jgi:hypothetical protein